MAGQTYTKLEPGDRCIIHVNTVNSPPGWWWGIVDSIEWNDDHRGGWGRVEAHITGSFQFKADRVIAGDGLDPVYGDDTRKPSVNYTVYAADRDTRGLVRRLRANQKDLNRKLQEANIRNDELREVIKAMVPSMDRIVEAVQKAVKPQQ